MNPQPTGNAMKIQFAKDNVEVSEAVRGHVERRLSLVFGRFGARIGRVVVRFSDVNGHPGGVYRRCQVDVDLLPAGAVRTEDADADLFAAVDRAADRAARSIARAVERERGMAVPRPFRGSALNRRHWPEDA